MIRHRLFTPKNKKDRGHNKNLCLFLFLSYKSIVDDLYRFVGIITVN